MSMDEHVHQIKCVLKILWKKILNLLIKKNALVWIM